MCCSAGRELYTFIVTSRGHGNLRHVGFVCFKARAEAKRIIALVSGRLWRGNRICTQSAKYGDFTIPIQEDPKPKGYQGGNKSEKGNKMNQPLMFPES